MLSIPTVEKSEIIHSPFFKIQKDTLLLNNTTRYDYYSLLLKPAAVMILAFNDDNKLILVKEWRHPTKQILLGSPGGAIEDNEDPITAAKREFLEETGYKSDEFKEVKVQDDSVEAAVDDDFRIVHPVGRIYSQ